MDKASTLPKINYYAKLVFLGTYFALGIEVNFFVPSGRNPFCEVRAKDCNVKPDPQGKRPKPTKEPKLFRVK